MMNFGTNTGLDIGDNGYGGGGATPLDDTTPDEERPPPPPPPPQAPRVRPNVNEPILTTSQPQNTTPTNIAPLDFFADFKELVHTKLNEIEQTLHTFQTEKMARDAEAVQELHIDVIHAMNHLSSLVQHELMDAKYLMTPPDQTVLEMANTCQYYTHKDFEEFAHQTTSKAAYAAGLLEFTGGAEDLMFHCKDGNIWNQVKKHNPKITTKFRVAACPFHRFQVENMNYVTIISRSMLIAVDDKDKESKCMFYYTLKRGL